MHVILFLGILPLYTKQRKQRGKQEKKKNKRISQKTHDIVSTSIRRLNDVATSYRHLIDVETTSCVYLEVTNERNTSLIENDVDENKQSNKREKNINKFEDAIPFVKEYESSIKTKIMGISSIAFLQGMLFKRLKESGRFKYVYSVFQDKACEDFR